MARRQSPGVPQLLRVLNDRAALNLLFAEGPQTRAQLAAATSLSKVTASQMVERLEARGLIQTVGTRAGSRGPNAQVYAVVGSYAHTVGVEVRPDAVTALCADLQGEEVGRAKVVADEGEEPVTVVHRAVEAAAADAGITVDRVRRVMLATPGLIDPSTGDIGFAWDLPSWHHGLHDALEADLQLPVGIENDVNLAAVAEHRGGAAHGVDDFVYVWFSRGIGVGVVLGGKLHRGATGGAGEIGYLPAPGVSLPEYDVAQRAKGSYQRLVGADIVLALAAEHGLQAPDAAEAVRMAFRDEAAHSGFLQELSQRVAVGVTSVCTVLDPSLVVLGGDVGYAGGEPLARLVGEAVPKIAPIKPRLTVGRVGPEPVLEGAIHVALDVVREEIFAEE